MSWRRGTGSSSARSAPSKASSAQQEARWTRIRHELERLELPSAVVEEVGDRLTSNTHVPGEVRRTLVATPEGVVFDDVHEGHDAHPEVVDLAPLPDLSAWIAREDAATPFVLAVVDREGADVEVYRASSRPVAAHDSVTGDTVHVRKVPSGGWSHRRYQETAENAWRHNARLVVEAVLEALDAHPAPLVLVAGEVRARSEVVRAWEEGATTARLVEVESGGRGAGASDDALWHEVQEHLRRHTAEADADALARLDEARGRDRGAAAGADDVLDALAKAQVDRLLLDLGGLRDADGVRPGEHPGLPLPAGVGDAELPLDRVLVAAAALSAADLTVLPASLLPDQRPAALLRWEG
ncbi:baeRF2 domain-containing protein [Nocardioides aurantiacus]|uniref:baeRF2 domain-containing protein n=1 Tax=Nocardioides aurantiacus TaxID=86796 RepID=UPI00403F21C6